MNKNTKKTNGIKDSISKLFILRDSCAGTCITQKDNPNIMWFEGAAVLLEEGVDKLKSAKLKMDSGSEDARKDFYCNVKDTISKLTVLKSSCLGGASSEETNENVIWFEGAESIISEVLDHLQKALPKTETQAVTPAATGSSKTGVIAVSNAADEDNDAVEAAKQAAAG
jgi:hypothetical protein